MHLAAFRGAFRQLRESNPEEALTLLPVSMNANTWESVNDDQMLSTRTQTLRECIHQWNKLMKRKTAIAFSDQEGHGEHAPQVANILCFLYNKVGSIVSLQMEIVFFC